MSGVYRSIQQAQVSIDRLTKDLQDKLSKSADLAMETSVAEVQLRKLDSTFSDRRIESIKLIEMQSSLKKVLEVQKIKNETVDAELKTIEEKTSNTREMMLQYRILYCRKLNEINQNYLKARGILRKCFLEEYEWIKEKIEHSTTDQI